MSSENTDMGTQTPSTSKIDRRSAIVLIGVFALSLFGVGTTIFVRIKDGVKRKRSKGGFEIGRVDDFVTGPNVVSLYRVIVYKERSANSAWLLSAVSLTCTHQVCILNTDSEGFTCPCHGSRFSHQGKVLKGPATKNLPWFRLEKNAAGNLELFPAEFVDAGWRLEVDAV